MSINFKKPNTYFVIIFVLAIIGIVIEIYVSAHRPDALYASKIASGLNLLAFFTTQSNLLVAGTSLMLATKSKLSEFFWAMRLAALSGISFTFIIHRAFLVQPIEDPLAQISDALVHLVVPLGAMFVWIKFGPRKKKSIRTILLAMTAPLAWIIFTYIRGAIIHWYPYEFLDVDKIGYAQSFQASVTALGIFALLAYLIKRTEDFFERDK